MKKLTYLFFILIATSTFAQAQSINVALENAEDVVNGAGCECCIHVKGGDFCESTRSEARNSCTHALGSFMGCEGAECE